MTEQLRVTGGDRGVLRGEEFKRYVTKLRARSSVYKRQRAELAQVKAEGGVLARTLDILKTRLNELGTDEVSQPFVILQYGGQLYNLLQEINTIVIKIFF